ncbi:hypothetical protein F7725_025389 [Dissostichus mawsoni]|uniref:Uncharacterized protein n=1 Tax=Dissostichus mawsoni TaxID=36200 RepID=A0A7J5XB01_DISMA|nr:hypothetical protein F7725_025389 [Dissostichus mawsoni]
MKGLNVNLCNYVLSHARYAVKIRRDLTYGMSSRGSKQKTFKWHAHTWIRHFPGELVEGCALVDVNDNGNLVYAYDGKVGSKTDGKNDNEPRKDTTKTKNKDKSKKMGEEETRKEKGSERVRGERLYEVTMRTCLGKMKIMEGLRVNGVMVHAQDLLNNDLTRSHS